VKLHFIYTSINEKRNLAGGAELSVDFPSSLRLEIILRFLRFAVHSLITTGLHVVIDIYKQTLCIYKMQCVVTLLPAASFHSAKHILKTECFNCVKSSVRHGMEMTVEN
jgi:hypothetical protein